MITRYIRSFSIALFLVSVGMSATFVQAQDPGAPGPLAVSREEYNFGDTAFAPTDFPGPVSTGTSPRMNTDLHRRSNCVNPCHSRALLNRHSRRTWRTQWQ